MKEYVTKRKNVCAGQLVDTKNAKITIYTKYDQFSQINEIIDTSISGVRTYRSMLFDINEDGLANDLIYTTSTNYPIQGVRPEYYEPGSIIITNYVELEDLLAYLRYSEDLTQKDLEHIYNRLILKNIWLERHKGLFGIKESESKLPLEIYEKLNVISSFGKGEASEKEPGYSLIKKKEIKKGKRKN